MEGSFVMDFKPPKKPEGEEGGAKEEKIPIYISQETVTATLSNSSISAATGTVYTTLTRTVQTTEKVATKYGEEEGGEPMQTPPPKLPKLMELMEGGEMPFGPSDEEGGYGEEEEEDYDNATSSQWSSSAPAPSSSPVVVQISVQVEEVPQTSVVYTTETAPAISSSTVCFQPTPWLPAAAPPKTVVTVPANPDVATKYEYVWANTDSSTLAPAASMAVTTSTETTTTTATTTDVTTSTKTDTATWVAMSTKVNTSTKVDTSTEVDHSTKYDTSTRYDTSTKVDTSTEVDKSTYMGSSTEVNTSSHTVRTVYETITATPSESDTWSSTSYVSSSKEAPSVKSVKSVSLTPYQNSATAALNDQVIVSSTPKPEKDSSSGAAPRDAKWPAWVPLLGASGLFVLAVGRWY